MSTDVDGELVEAVTRYRDAEVELAAARQELATQIVAFRRGGRSQVAAIALTGLSREQIRRIERANGFDSG